MIASFEYELIREGSEEAFYLEVVYEAHRYGSRWDAEVDVELLSVTLDGIDFDTTAEEDAALLSAAQDRVDDDFEADEAAYGDYINDMREDR